MIKTKPINSIGLSFIHGVGYCCFLAFRLAMDRKAHPKVSDCPAIAILSLW